nr:microtubule-associated protein futsch [Leptinotarsa decemlineata]
MYITGDAALFGINGFNMLLDGGFSRKACFWDFVRHLDRLDAVLMTRLNNSNVGGISSVLRRKKQDAVYPQLGHFFCNIQERKSLLSPDGDKDKDPLLINLLDEGQEIISNLRHLNLNPQVCYRDSEPINLYHKVGHGTLDMYVLSPAKDSREVREFLQKWNQSDQKLFANSKSSREFNFPIQNLISIAALLVWQPANPNDTITRIMFPGSSPQNKIFEGLDRLKNLEFIKHSVCTERSLVPISITKKTAKETIIEKVTSKERTPVDKKENKIIENNLITAVNGDIKEKEKIVKKSDSTESDRSIKTKKIEDHKLIENGDKSFKPKTRTAKSRSDSQQRKKTVEKKASPTTPKKSIENGEAKKPTKPSPIGTPAKSAKDATNRKVIESKTKREAMVKPQQPTESKPKVERKPISRRPVAKKAPISPAKKLVSSVQKPDSISRKGKLDKEGTTDSSTVSTPSADQDTALKKDLSKLTPEEIQQLKAQELADLKEEQEAVKEIEAVFRKGETLPAQDEALRKVKDESLDEKLNKEEYLIIEKEEIDQESLNETKEKETQKLARDSEESEKQRKLSTEDKIKDISPEVQREVDGVESQVEGMAKTKVDVSESCKVASLEEKLDLSTDKKTNEKEADEEIKDVIESQPDEKISANIKSGDTTTAPTLPEDERIPLDEIKEDNGQIVEEKYVKEETKEKDIPVIQLPQKQIDNFSKLPGSVGIRLDKQQHIRDIVKTPDEVADLPVHEEVDYEYTHELKAETPKSNEILEKELEHDEHAGDMKYSKEHEKEVEQEKDKDEVVQESTEHIGKSAMAKELTGLVETVKVGESPPKEDILKESDQELRRKDLTGKRDDISDSRPDHITDTQKVQSDVETLADKFLDTKEKVSTLETVQNIIEGKAEKPIDITSELKVEEKETKGEVVVTSLEDFTKHEHILDVRKLQSNIEIADDKPLDTKEKIFNLETIQNIIESEVEQQIETTPDLRAAVKQAEDERNVDTKLEDLSNKAESISRAKDENVTEAKEVHVEIESSADGPHDTKEKVSSLETVKKIIDSETEKPIETTPDLKAEIKRAEHEKSEDIKSKDFHDSGDIILETKHEHIIDAQEVQSKIETLTDKLIDNKEEIPSLEMVQKIVEDKAEQPFDIVPELNAEKELTEHEGKVVTILKDFKEKDDSIPETEHDHKINVQEVKSEIETSADKVSDTKEKVSPLETVQKCIESGVEQPIETTPDLKVKVKQAEDHISMDTKLEDLSDKAESVPETKDGHVTEAKEVPTKIEISADGHFDTEEKISPLETVQHIVRSKVEQPVETTPDLKTKVKQEEGDISVNKKLEDLSDMGKSIPDTKDEHVTETKEVHAKIDESLDMKEKISSLETVQKIVESGVEQPIETSLDLKAKVKQEENERSEDKKLEDMTNKEKDISETKGEHVTEVKEVHDKIETSTDKPLDTEETMSPLEIVQKMIDSGVEQPIESFSDLKAEVKRTENERSVDIKSEDSSDKAEGISKTEDEHVTQAKVVHVEIETSADRPLDTKEIASSMDTVRKMIESDVERSIETTPELKAELKPAEDERKADTKFEPMEVEEKIELVMEKNNKNLKVSPPESVEVKIEDEQKYEQITEAPTITEVEAEIERIDKGLLKATKEGRDHLVELEEKLQGLKQSQGENEGEESHATIINGDDSALITESIEKSIEKSTEEIMEDFIQRDNIEHRLPGDVIEKGELGRKSPKEREEDVIKIVASVAEVLKSDAPLEEFEGKLPITTTISPYTTPFTTELRETHITTVDSPVIEYKVIKTDIPTIPEEPHVASASLIEEEKRISEVYDSTHQKLEDKRSSLLKESQELMMATSKIISDIKSGKPDETVEIEEPKKEVGGKFKEVSLDDEFEVQEEKTEDEESGTIHRMLVTASSEDGGEEIEICPPGTITFPRSSESSGRSSPDPSQKVFQKSSWVETISDASIIVKQIGEPESEKLSGPDEEEKEISHPITVAPIQLSEDTSSLEKIITGKTTPDEKSEASQKSTPDTSDLEKLKKDTFDSLDKVDDRGEIKMTHTDKCTEEKQDLTGKDLKEKRELSESVLDKKKNNVVDFIEDTIESSSTAVTKFPKSIFSDDKSEHLSDVTVSKVGVEKETTIFGSDNQKMSDRHVEISEDGKHIDISKSIESITKQEPFENVSEVESIVEGIKKSIKDTFDVVTDYILGDEDDTEKLNEEICEDETKKQALIAKKSDEQTIEKKEITELKPAEDITETKNGVQQVQHHETDEIVESIQEPKGKINLDVIEKITDKTEEELEVLLDEEVTKAETTSVEFSIDESKGALKHSTVIEQIGVLEKKTEVLKQTESDVQDMVKKTDEITEKIVGEVPEEIEVSERIESEILKDSLKEKPIVSEAQEKVKKHDEQKKMVNDIPDKIEGLEKSEVLKDSREKTKVNDVQEKALFELDETKTVVQKSIEDISEQPDQKIDVVSTTTIKLDEILDSDNEKIPRVISNEDDSVIERDKLKELLHSFDDIAETHKEESVISQAEQKSRVITPKISESIDIEGKPVSTISQHVLQTKSEELKDMTCEVSELISSELEKTHDHLSSLKDEVEEIVSDIITETKNISKNLLDNVKHVFEETTYAISTRPEDSKTVTDSNDDELYKADNLQKTDDVLNEVKEDMADATEKGLVVEACKIVEKSDEKDQVSLDQKIHETTYLTDGTKKNYKMEDEIIQDCQPSESRIEKFKDVDWVVEQVIQDESQKGKETSDIQKETSCEVSDIVSPKSVTIRDTKIIDEFITDTTSQAKESVVSYQKEKTDDHSMESKDYIESQKEMLSTLGDETVDKLSTAILEQPKDDEKLGTIPSKITSELDKGSEKQMKDDTVQNFETKVDETIATDTFAASQASKRGEDSVISEMHKTVVDDKFTPSDGIEEAKKQETEKFGDMEKEMKLDSQSETKKVETAIGLTKQKSEEKSETRELTYSQKILSGEDTIKEKSLQGKESKPCDESENIDAAQIEHSSSVKVEEVPITDIKIDEAEKKVYMRTSDSVEMKKSLHDATEIPIIKKEEKRRESDENNTPVDIVTVQGEMKISSKSRESGTSESAQSIISTFSEASADSDKDTIKSHEGVDEYEDSIEKGEKQLDTVGDVKKLTELTDYESKTVIESSDIKKSTKEKDSDTSHKSQGESDVHKKKLSEIEMSDTSELMKEDSALCKEKSSIDKHTETPEELIEKSLQLEKSSHKKSEQDHEVSSDSMKDMTQSLILAPSQIESQIELDEKKTESLLESKELVIDESTRTLKEKQHEKTDKEKDIDEIEKSDSTEQGAIVAGKTFETTQQSSKCVTSESRELKETKEFDEFEHTKVLKDDLLPKPLTETGISRDEKDQQDLMKQEHLSKHSDDESSKATEHIEAVSSLEKTPHGIFKGDLVKIEGANLDEVTKNDILEQSAKDLEHTFETIEDMSKSVIFETCKMADSKMVEDGTKTKSVETIVVGDKTSEGISESVVSETCEMTRLETSNNLLNGHFEKSDTEREHLSESTLHKTTDKRRADFEESEKVYGDGELEETLQDESAKYLEDDIETVTDPEITRELSVDLQKEKSDADKTVDVSLFMKQEDLVQKNKDDRLEGVSVVPQKSTKIFSESEEKCDVEKEVEHDTITGESGKEQELKSAKSSIAIDESIQYLPQSRDSAIVDDTGKKIEHENTDAEKQVDDGNNSRKVGWETTGEICKKIEEKTDPDKKMPETIPGHAVSLMEKPSKNFEDGTEAFSHTPMEEVSGDSQKISIDSLDHEKCDAEKEFTVDDLSKPSKQICDKKSDLEKNIETKVDSNGKTEKVAITLEKTAKDLEETFETMTDMSRSVIFETSESGGSKTSITDELTEKSNTVDVHEKQDTIEKYLGAEKVTSTSIGISKPISETSDDQEQYSKHIQLSQECSDSHKEEHKISQEMKSDQPAKTFAFEKSDEETMEKCDRDSTQSVFAGIEERLEKSESTRAGPSISEKPITDSESDKESQETLLHEKHIPGAITPPTVPVSPNILEETTKLTVGSQVSMREVDVRSVTPVSDDSEIIGSTQTDISERTSKVLLDKESDDEDQLSIMSQVAHSRDSSHCEFDDDFRRVDPMSMSMYGSLPGETSTEQEVEPSYLFEITRAKYPTPSVDKTDEKLTESTDETKSESTHISETSSSSVSQEKKDPVASWGKPLGLPAPTYLYEITQAKFSTPRYDINEDRSCQTGTVIQSGSEDRDGYRFGSQPTDMMTASFYGDLPSDEKDPLSAWGKPLGLPSPAPPNDNKGTPKKERKLPPNVTAKNKLNDDRKRAESPSKYNKNKKIVPVYVDLTYVPHHGNTNYSYVDFFRRIRARYYVFSGIEPSRDVYNALLEAKQTWEDKDLEVTIIPTYDTDILGYWVAENEEMLTKYKIDLSPSASRCTINLQDHETSCSAYRLEF